MSITIAQKYYLWKEVFSKDKYLISAFILVILLYILNASMSVWSGLVYTGDIFDIIRLYTREYYLTVGIFAFFSTVILSILTAILLSLLWYRAEITKLGIKKNMTILDYISIFFGITVSGCPTCGLGLIAILGLGAGVAALPFKGAEITVVALIIVIFALYQVTNRILSCEIISNNSSVK